MSLLVTTDCKLVGVGMDAHGTSVFVARMSL